MSTDPHWCYGTCGYRLGRAVPRASVLAGSPTPIKVMIVCGEPAVLSPWWQEYVCSHGFSYWVRPTDAQLAQWEADGTP